MGFFEDTVAIKGYRGAPGTFNISKQGLGTDVSVSGYLELDNMLKHLPKKLVDKAIRVATREVAHIVRDVAYAKAPKKSHTMANALKVRTATNLRRGTIGHRVVLDWEAQKSKALKKGQLFDSPFYGQFIEFGWDDKPEGIPFIRPALYDNADKLESIVKRRVVAHINSLQSVVKAGQPLTGSALAKAAAKNMRDAWKQERMALSQEIIESAPGDIE